MKREEQIAEQYLISKGFNTIEYEPDGNVPPDFLIDSEIAVEVRRLNQHWFNSGDSEPLEKLEYDFMPRFLGLLKSYESREFDKSSFVSVRFSRPMKSTKDVIKVIKEHLDEHLADIHRECKHRIGDEVELKIFPAASRHSSPFILGIQIDNDSGGYVVSNICDSLKIIVEEKQKKVYKYRSKYNRWWLALVDFIGYGLSEDDLKQLTEHCDIKHDFEKIILIPPLRPDMAVEIKK